MTILGHHDYTTIQNSYKKWFNRLGKKKADVKRGQKIRKIAELFREVSAKVLSNCWVQSSITALRPSKSETLSADEIVDLEAAYAEYETLNQELENDGPAGQNEALAPADQSAPGPSGIEQFLAASKGTLGTAVDYPVSHSGVDLSPGGQSGTNYSLNYPL